jgi:hypothetical protein
MLVRGAVVARSGCIAFVDLNKRAQGTLDAHLLINGSKRIAKCIWFLAYRVGFDDI